MAREGLPFVFISLSFAVIGFLFFPPLGLFLLGLTGFIAFFFRDPKREVPTDPHLIVSPADGRITSIARVHSHSLNQEVTRITIFLSIWNVHINRSPIAGKVLSVKHVAGKFYPAFLTKATTDNEHTVILLQNSKVVMVVRQIAGLIAKRIICYLSAGKEILQGQKIGLIRFGSCVEIDVPGAIQLHIKKDDHVRGGETIIADILEKKSHV